MSLQEEEKPGVYVQQRDNSVRSQQGGGHCKAKRVTSEETIHVSPWILDFLLSELWKSKFL